VSAPWQLELCESCEEAFYPANLTDGLCSGCWAEIVGEAIEHAEAIWPLADDIQAVKNELKKVMP